MSLFAFCMAAAVLALTPGPGMAYVVARTVFRARLGSGISANPYLQFWVVPEESGELLVQWQDDLGQKGEVRARVDVTPA